VIDELFSTPIGSYRFNYNLLSVEDWCYNERNKSDGRECSNEGGWQSNDCELDTLISTPLEDICYGILEKSEEFAHSFGIDHTPSIVNLWININPKNCYNRIHIHPESRLSGVFWIKSTNTDDSGPLVFMRENSYALETIAPIETKYSVNRFGYVPLSNNMLLFPSYLPHQVLPNKSDEDRISISFNLL
tara:strand:- start:174 stop:740 length:567 start_codon:yes stop_codon:yes gene_type:complete